MEIEVQGKTRFTFTIVYNNSVASENLNSKCDAKLTQLPNAKMPKLSHCH